MRFGVFDRKWDPLQRALGTIRQEELLDRAIEGQKEAAQRITGILQFVKSVKYRRMPSTRSERSIGCFEILRRFQIYGAEGGLASRGRKNRSRGGSLLHDTGSSFK